MADPERLGVATFVLVLLGLSYLVAVQAFAAEYLLPAGFAYALVAAVVILRLVVENEPSDSASE
jgi:energy-converting hydrogenase Eha subunit H